jgi:hypothetical protein
MNISYQVTSNSNVDRYGKFEWVVAKRPNGGASPAREDGEFGELYTTGGRKIIQKSENQYKFV